MAIVAITMGGYFYNAIFTLLALLAWREYGNLLENIGIRIDRVWGYFFIFLLMLGISTAQYTLSLMACIVGILVLGLIYIFGRHISDLSALAFSCLGFFYVQTGFITLILMRDDALYRFLELPAAEQGMGTTFIWLLLLCTWASDTFAYFTGRAIGRRKIVPHISPSKTLEGFVGGFVGCVSTGVIYSMFTAVELQSGLIIGILVGVFAPFGDLFESKIKRNCEVKDSGVLLPGHGGVLDRFDSLLFSAPVIFVYLLHL